MSKYLLLFIYFISPILLNSQSYGYNLIDIGQNGSNLPYDIQWKGGEYIFILSGDVYNNAAASQISLLNEELEIINFEFDTIWPGNEFPLTINDQGDYVLIGHRPFEEVDPIFVKRGNFFSEESTLEYVLNDKIKGTNEGHLFHGNKLYIYGDLRNQVNNLVDGYIAIFDSTSMDLDTLIHYNQNANENHIRRLSVLSDSTLVFINDTELGATRIYNINKIDLQGNILDSFQIDVGSSFKPVLSITESEEIIFSSVDFLSPFEELANGKIHKLNKDFETIEWSYILDQTPEVIEVYNIFEIHELKNNDILVTGQFFEGISGDTAQYYGFLQRLTKDGEPLWFKRYHVPFAEPHPTAGWVNNAYFRRVAEKEDGSLIVLGRSRSLEPDINHYLWLLSLTPDGCLSEDEDVCDPTGIIVNTKDIPDELIQYHPMDAYPNPTNGQSKIEFGESISGYYSVYDIFGAVVDKGQLIQEDELILNFNTPGAYSIQIFSLDNQWFVSRIHVVK